MITICRCLRFINPGIIVSSIFCCIAAEEPKVDIHTLYSSSQAFRILNDADRISTYAVFENAVPAELGIAAKIILDDPIAEEWAQKLLQSQNPAAHFYGVVIMAKLQPNNIIKTADLFKRPFLFQNACVNEIASINVLSPLIFPNCYIYPDNDVIQKDIHRFAKISSSTQFQLNGLALYNPSFTLAEVGAILSDADSIHLDDQSILPYALYFAAQEPDGLHLAEHLISASKSNHGKLYGVILKSILTPGQERVGRELPSKVILKFSDETQLIDCGEFIRQLNEETSLVRERVVAPYPKFLPRATLHKLAHQR